MTDLQTLAETLRKRGVVVSLQRARGLAAEHGCTVSKGFGNGRRQWWLYRTDGMGTPVLYHNLVELVAALVPPK